MLNQIDAQTTEAHIIEALTQMLASGVNDFSAYEVTLKARTNHPQDYIPHVPAISQIVHREMAVNADYEVDPTRQAPNGASYLAYVLKPASAQVVVQTPAQNAQPAQIPQVVGITTNWTV